MNYQFLLLRNVMLNVEVRNLYLFHKQDFFLNLNIFHHYYQDGEFVLDLLYTHLMEFYDVDLFYVCHLDILLIFFVDYLKFGYFDNFEYEIVFVFDFDIDYFDIDYFDIDYFDIDYFDIGYFDIDYFDIDYFDIDYFEIGCFGIGCFGIGCFGIDYFGVFGFED